MIRHLTRPTVAFPGLVALLLALSGCGLDPTTLEPMPPTPSGPKAVLLRLDGDLPTFRAPGELFASGPTQRDFEKLLGRATSDLAVQEIVIQISTLGVSWARAAELAATIARAAKSGKALVCQLEEADNISYFVAASGCPRIAISPAGGLALVGLSLESIYLREAMASLGLTAEMMHIGRYKGAAEPLLRDDMSPEAREANTSLLDETNRIFLNGIASGRKITPEAVQKLVDAGPYDAPAALAAGLVDEINPLAARLEALRGRWGGGVDDEYGKTPPRPFGLADLVKLFGAEEDAGKPAQPRIAIIPAMGPVVSGDGEDLFGGSEVIADVALVHALGEAGRDDSIRAVVLRIDSPGGSPLASDNINQAIALLKAKKPVIVSMGDVAASGGYYIAAAATEIVAEPGTLTGSIGVVGGKIVIGEALTKLGIHTDVMTRGARAALDSPLRPFGDEEREVVRRSMEQVYELFLKRVAEGRRLPLDKIRAVAEGRVWTGSQAKEHGLVDRLGSLEDALVRARELGKLPAGAPAEIFPRPKSIFETLGERLGQAESESALLGPLFVRVPGARDAIGCAALLKRERVLAYSPFVVDIR